MNKLKTLFIIAIVAMIAACTKDIVVQDIKDKSVNILAPANNLKTAENAITFWWDLVDGAEKYNLQIVRPDFNAIQKLVLDTNITGNKYTRSLTPGKYQWRIKAYNANGSTVYNVYNLSIDTASNLSAQLVVSNFPLSGHLTAAKSITLSWTGIASATNYQVQVLNGTSSVVKDTTVTETQYVFSTGATTNNVYAFSWKVKAFNNTSLTQFNPLQTFTVDLKAPNPPANFSPATLTNHSSTVTLVWTRNGQTITDVRYDSIYIATDSTFPGFAVAVAARVNSTSINTAAFSPSLQPNTSLSQNYFWKVRSIDTLGNKSQFSNWFKFHLNP